MSCCRCKACRKAKPAFSQFKVGDRVRVTSGAFANRRANVLSIDSRGWVLLPFGMPDGIRFLPSQVTHVESRKAVRS